MTSQDKESLMAVAFVLVFSLGVWLGYSEGMSYVHRNIIIDGEHLIYDSILYKEVAEL